MTKVSSCAQIVFRSDPGKFKKLKTECSDFLIQCFEFMKLITSLEVMAGNFKAMDLPQIVSQVCNWQVELILHD